MLWRLPCSMLAGLNTAPILQGSIQYVGHTAGEDYPPDNQPCQWVLLVHFSPRTLRDLLLNEALCCNAVQCHAQHPGNVPLVGSCSHVLGVFNPASGKLQLVPLAAQGQILRMEPRLLGLKVIEGAGDL